MKLTPKKKIIGKKKNFFFHKFILKTYLEILGKHMVDKDKQKNTKKEKKIAKKIRYENLLKDGNYPRYNKVFFEDSEFQVNDFVILVDPKKKKKLLVAKILEIYENKKAKLHKNWIVAR